MGIDAAHRLAAGVEPLAVLHDGRVQRLDIGLGLEKRVAQRLHIARQGVKGAHMRAVALHAQAQLGRKTGGADLRLAVGDGIHQAVVPAPGVARRVGREQGGELLGLGFFQRTQPLRIKTAGRHQGKQRGRVMGFRRAGQQLVAQALGQFADKGRARGKAEIGQQRGHVHRLQQRLPPGVQARLQLGLPAHRVDEDLKPRQRRWHRGLVAAKPLEQPDQPDMALGQGRIGVERREQGGQVLEGALHGTGCRALVQHALGRAAAMRGFEHEQGNGHLKALAVLGHAEKTPVHRAAGRAQARAAGVLEGFARLEQRLVAHHAQALDLFVEAVGVGDDPVARDQLRGHRAGVGEGDGVGKTIDGLARL